MDTGAGVRTCELGGQLWLVEEGTGERAGQVCGLMAVELDGGVMDWNKLRLVLVPIESPGRVPLVIVRPGATVNG